MGPGFITFAQPVFERCVRIVKNSLIEFSNFKSDPTRYDEPDKTFLIVSLDLLSGLTQGLNTTITELYQSSDPPVLTLLAHCLQVRAFLPSKQALADPQGHTSTRIRPSDNRRTRSSATRQSRASTSSSRACPSSCPA